MSHCTYLDQTDYFSTIPPTYNHFSTETPCCSPGPIQDDAVSYPEHPLLAAYRDIHNASRQHESPHKMAANFMSVQTAAAHGHNASRPRPQPMQNVLHVTNSDDSASSSSSKSSRGSAVSSLETARCSRCQRTPSIDIKTGNSNMIQYGLNLWYCSRCAAIVGFGKR